MSDELNKELGYPTLVDNELDKKIKDLEDKAQKEKESIDLALQETKIRLIYEYTNKKVFHTLIPRVRERDWYYTVGLGIDKKTEYGFNPDKDRSQEDHRNCNYYHNMEDAYKARERMLLMHKVLTIRDAINAKHKLPQHKETDKIYELSAAYRDETESSVIDDIKFVQLAKQIKYTAILRFYTSEARNEFLNLVGWEDVKKFVNL